MFPTKSKCDQECAEGDDDDSGPAGDVGVNCVDKLSANDDVHRCPPEPRQTRDSRHDADTISSKPEATKNHLAQTEYRAEARKVARWQHPKEVCEQDDQHGIDDAKTVDGLAEDSNGEVPHDHVRRQPHRAQVD
ncbi:unnamed protein product [Phytophthora fragariaefolia]|uniref:Unnamed protein product n=1 Tax=Phytophthora fragariaefolia TaxID=1490495 RepID=A0A9W7D6B7_9STRA|nr:unnamed protein product [Phytophthora fragariaefolia]